MRNRVLSFIFIFIFSFPVWGAARKNSTELYKEAVKIAARGNTNEAIDAFKKVVEVNPYYALGHYGLGRAYLNKEGMLNDAIRHLKLSVTYDRILAKGYYYLGMALMLKKRYNAAIDAFSNAYKYDKSFIGALYNIGAIYELLEKNNKAAQYFDEYLYQKEKKEEDILF